MGKTIVYGIGGYDPSKPNDNIVEIIDEDITTPLPEDAVSKLRSLGLDIDDLNLLLG